MVFIELAPLCKTPCKLLERGLIYNISRHVTNCWSMLLLSCISPSMGMHNIYDVTNEKFIMNVGDPSKKLSSLATYTNSDMNVSIK